jgi:hypothetical protein
MALTQAEAKPVILDEWRVWPKEHGGDSAHDMTLFFHITRKNKPDLFKFKCSGDPWQVVKGWIQNHGTLNRI